MDVHMYARKGDSLFKHMLCTITSLIQKPTYIYALYSYSFAKPMVLSVVLLNMTYMYTNVCVF